MHKEWANKKGFTIIELLVAIVVIGILAGIMIVSYTGIQQRARDSERGGDVTLLKVAISKYYAEKSAYPRACGNDNSACAISSLSTELAPYLDTIPHDPSVAVDSAKDYKYVAGSISGPPAYAILVNYEAKPVCKTGFNVATGWWGAAIPTC